MNLKEIELKLFGKVQGVGLRKKTKREAEALDVFGYVENLSDGSVEIVAQGEEDVLKAFIEIVRRGTVFSEIREVKEIWQQTVQDRYTEFEIYE